jgi:4-amino-4-deoxy-L-arabinose transferase-like glycosyltransferase
MLSNSDSFSKNFLFFGYFLFLILFLFLGLDVSSLVDWDENVYSESSKQMLQRKDYINIYLNGDLFHEKPPFFLWLQVLSYKIFGVSEFSARFPSALFGFFSVLLCIFTGKYIHSLRLGCLTGLIYITSFLPAILSKSAVLDTTFNFWIMSALVCLFVYDQKKKEWLQSQANRKQYLFFLLIAAISMGLAVLTKGIVGGAIPVFSFCIYKFFRRFPKISFLDTLLCGFVALFTASSWFILNFFASGTDYFLQSLEFQKKLLFQSSQGHSGPFYYHFVALFFGFFPWSIFLFSRFQKKFSWNIFSKKRQENSLKDFLVYCFCQLAFILFVFSLVKNKLPHYSAFAYFPLSLIVALVFYRHFKEKVISTRIFSLFFVFCLVIGIFFFCFHWIMQWWLVKNDILFSLQWSKAVYFTGVSLFLLAVLAFIFFLKKKKLLAIAVIAVMNLCLSQGIWRLQLPIFQQFSQDLLVKQVASLQKTGEVVFYEFTAVAPIFYNNRDIPTFGSSIFNEPKLDLKQNHSRKIYIITKGEQNKQKLEKEFFNIQFIRKTADLYIYEKTNIE